MNTRSGLHTWHDFVALGCGTACLLMVVQMLFSFNMASGRARRQSPVP